MLYSVHYNAVFREPQASRARVLAGGRKGNPERNRGRAREDRMVQKKNDRTQEGQLPEGKDPYWDKLVRGIRVYGSSAEQQALRAVVQSLAHAELHPTEKLAGQIGHGKGRHQPRRVREAVG